MKTYFEVAGVRHESRQYVEIFAKKWKVGGEQFGSRELAEEAVRQWQAMKGKVYSVLEVQHSEVTRKSIKGNVVTEKVLGSLERVPRIISVRTLDTTYTAARAPLSELTQNDLRHATHFPTRAEAETYRAQVQARAEELATLTEADIIEEQQQVREVLVPTLEDVLDHEHRKRLLIAVVAANNNLTELRKQADTSIKSQVTDLEAQIAALKAKAAQDCGVVQAELEREAAEDAYHKAIHYDEFEEKALAMMVERHRNYCWPDSYCRVAGECTYEPCEWEIQEHIVEHANDFELPEVNQEQAAQIQQIRVKRLLAPQYTGTVNGQPWWSNGHIMFRGAEENIVVLHKVTMQPVYDGATKGAKFEPLEFKEFRRLGDGSECAVLMVNGAERCFIQKVYYDYCESKGYKLLVGNNFSAFGCDYPYVIAKHNDEIVGIIAPCSDDASRATALVETCPNKPEAPSIPAAAAA